MTSWLKFKYRSLWQHPLWGKFQMAIGRKVFQLEASNASALIIKHPLPFGLSWLEVPRGPLFEDETSLQSILQKISELGQREKAVFVRFSSYQKLEIGNWKLEIGSGDHHPETSLMIDLSLSEEAILAQMKPKGRYNIRVAEKYGIEVREEKDVTSFYDILSQTAHRDGFSIHPKSYYQKMIDELGEVAQLLVAEYEGRVIAGGIFVYLDEWGIYYYGASNHHYRKCMAPYLVQWEAIKMAKKRGCRYYDFLGIAPEKTKNHPWAGVTDFKKKFGGRVVDYPPAKDMVLRPFWYWVYRIKRRFS